MEPRKYKPDDVLRAKDVNWLLERALAESSFQQGTRSGGAVAVDNAASATFDFRGQSQATIPAYSVFIVDSAVNTNNPPKVAIRQLTTSDTAPPPVMLTNGATAVAAASPVADQEVPCYIVADGEAVLLAADATNPPIAGETCGIKPDTWTVYSEGEGLLALTGPFTGPGSASVAWCLRIHGGGNGVSLFRFTLTGSWTGGVANADIKTMAGSAVESASVSDPELIFASLVVGSVGLCFKQGDVYYAIQAPCA